MDSLSLAWETFEFHDQNIIKGEELHYRNIKKFRSIRDKKSKLNEKDIKIFLQKMLKSIDSLSTNYHKQLSSLRDIIKLHSSDIDIPKHREVEVSSLLALANSLSTLLIEINLYKLEVEFFSLDFS